MSPEARVPSSSAAPDPPAWRDLGVGALLALPIALALSFVSPASYRSGAVAMALLVVIGLAMRWTVAAGAAPVLWLGIVAQITDSFTEGPPARDAVGMVVVAGSITLVVWALRRWEGDRRHARDEARARLRNERRLEALVEFAHRLAGVGSRPAMFAAVEQHVPSVAGGAGAVLMVRAGDRIEFPAVAGFDPLGFPVRPAATVDPTDPATAAMQLTAPAFFSTAAEFAARRPELGDFIATSGQAAWAVLPVRDVGVLVLTWREAQVFSAAQRAFLETVANLLSAATERIRVVEQAQVARFVAAFDAMLDGVGIHRAVRDASGRIVDLEVEYLNPASVHVGERRHDLIGRRMSELWPRSPTLPHYIRVIETGEPFVLEDSDVTALGGPYSDIESVSIRSSRLDDDRMVLVVRDVSERARLTREIREANEMFSVAQELAHVGSWRYDLASDRLTWSPELYRILGMPADAPALRPVDGVLFGVEHPQDRGRVMAIMQQALAERRPFSFDMRIVRQSDGEVRDLSTTGIVELDDDGALAGVWGATQDVTERRHAERSRRAALDALAHQREAVAALQRVILPSSLPAVPGAVLHACYRAATLSDAVGGDWYDAFATPDGRIVLAIGDVAGHGVECAALANQLRVSVRVRVGDGMEPGEILASLDAELVDAFATCWVAVFDPTSRRLRVASAGHLPAVLVRDGCARQVTERTAPPLGTGAVAPDRASEITLEPGDLLVLFTDGLVERRGEDIGRGLARLEATAPGLVPADDPALSMVGALAPDAADDVCVVTLRIA